MVKFSQVKTAGRYNRSWMKRDNALVLRQLLSNLVGSREDGINLSPEAQRVPMHQASADQARDNQNFLQNLASPEEGLAKEGLSTASLPIAIPVLPAASQTPTTSQSSALPPTSTVATSSLPSTPTPIRIASSTTTTTAPSASATSSSQSLCSGGASCLTTTSNFHPTATPSPTQAPHQSTSSSNTNSGMIFFGFLAGIAILAMTIATLSYAIKRWCNRRQRGRIDNDPWRFLEQTPKNFDYPFFGFQNKPSERIMGFADEKCISSFMDNKGGSWAAPEVPVQSHQSALLGSFQRYNQEHSGPYTGESALPDVMFPESSLRLQATNFYNHASVYGPPPQLPTAPARTFNDPASTLNVGGSEHQMPFEILQERQIKGRNSCMI